MDNSCVPSEASFFGVISSLCQLGSVQRAEELTLQMMRQRVRPGKELFNMLIRMFSDHHDAPKVEEWLLNAGQSGWTPEQAAFDAVVLLYADVDALKAEEWLSRGQQTEYRLPDECYGAVVQAFLRLGNSSKVNEWLSRMLGENRVPSDSLLREVISLHIETGDIPRAEAWLTQLAGRSSASVDGLRTALFDAAMRAGDIVYAERQLAALSEADAERTMQAVSALMERGDAARAKVLCERYRSLGGTPTLEICNALLYTCAATGDADGAERAIRALASVEPVSESQAVLLRRAMGEERAADLLEELGDDDSTLPPSSAQLDQQAPGQAPGLHRERSPTTLPLVQQASSGGPKAAVAERGAGKKTSTPSSAGNRAAAKASSATSASAKAQARRGPTTSAAGGASVSRPRPMR
uniref:Pentacotripeptide-repeat region of PRORP domain-containing protein n=1 Tax=Alexandrium catenella TaxID=2925 RepID=A0A7S1S2U5_ALECA